RDHSAGVDFSDLVPHVLHKPEIAIRPCGNPERPATDGGYGKLRDDPACGDLSDLITSLLREPEIAIRPCGDPERVAIGARGEQKLRDHSAGGDSPDLTHVSIRITNDCYGLSKPEIAVRPRGDPERVTIGLGGRKLRDHSAGGDFPDVVASELCKPEIAVRPRGDPVRVTGGGHGELRDHSARGDFPDLVGTVVRE